MRYIIYVQIGITFSGVVIERLTNQCPWGWCLVGDLEDRGSLIGQNFKESQLDAFSP